MTKQNQTGPKSKPSPVKSVLEIDTYVPGKSKIKGRSDVIKLSSNETALGPSPSAIKAYQTASDRLFRYPDGSAKALRDAIGKVNGLNPDQIVCGTGSDELLNLFAYAYLNEGDEAIYTEHGFLIYKIAILTAGGVPVVVPETDYKTDIDNILKAVTDKTKIVYIANPNNPTGTWLDKHELKKLRDGLPDHILLVLDGAYAEYVVDGAYDPGIELVNNTNNTVMTRTFSKIYGLAALRIGWCYGPLEICDILNRIRGPFNVSTPGILAGLAAMEDQAHIEKAKALNAVERAEMTKSLEALGLKVSPSEANFILVHFEPKGNFTAQKCDEFLLANGLITRRVTSYGLPHCLRISTDTKESREKLVAAIKTFLNRGS